MYYAGLGLGGSTDLFVILSDELGGCIFFYYSDRYRVFRACWAVEVTREEFAK